MSAVTNEGYLIRYIKLVNQVQIGEHADTGFQSRHVVKCLFVKRKQMQVQIDGFRNVFALSFG